MFNSQKINTDPTPLYSVLMRSARNGSTSEWAMRSISKDTAIETAIGVYPGHEVHSVGVIYNRPEYDNNPNPLLENFRLIDDGRKEFADWVRDIGQNPEKWAALYAPAHIDHARKVLKRLTRLTKATA